MFAQAQQARPDPPKRKGKPSPSSPASNRRRRLSSPRRRLSFSSLFSSNDFTSPPLPNGRRAAFAWPFQECQEEEREEQEEEDRGRAHLDRIALALAHVSARADMLPRTSSTRWTSTTNDSSFWPRLDDDLARWVRRKEAAKLALKPFLFPPNGFCRTRRRPPSAGGAAWATTSSRTAASASWAGPTTSWEVER